MFDNIIKKFIENKWKNRFNIKDKIFFFRELAYLINWWIVITDSILMIKENSENIAIKNLCWEIYSSLKKWEQFSRTISRLPKYFNDGDANIIRSWEGSGELVRVLKYLANEYDFLYDIKNKYIWAMIYPALIFFVSLIAVYIIFTVVLPWILVIVHDFDDLELPFATKALINITDFFVQNNISIIIVLIMSILAFSIFLWIQEWKRWFDKQIFKIPIFGNFTRKYLLVKYLRYNKLLISSGMSYKELYSSLKRLFNNYQYISMINDIQKNINIWQDVLEPLKNYRNIIPADVFVLLKSWQESANMIEAIDNAIELYQEEFNKDLNNLSKIIEPILVVFVWWIVAFIALSVFWIVWSILDSVAL